jgi:hypothetical protein
MHDDATMTTTTTTKERLADYIRNHGSVKTVRVSSVQGPGKYPYWRAKRYQIELSRDGVPSHRPGGHDDTTIRTSYRLAHQEAEEIAAQEGRILVEWRIGPLDESQCEYVLGQIKA